MFTKIGEYLKPILGRRDHIPLKRTDAIDPDEHHVRKIGEQKKKAKKASIDETSDVTDLSLEALMVIFEPEMLEDIDFYHRVKPLISKLRENKITHIPVFENERLIDALERAAKSD